MLTKVCETFHRNVPEGSLPCPVLRYNAVQCGTMWYNNTRPGIGIPDDGVLHLGSANTLQRRAVCSLAEVPRILAPASKGRPAFEQIFLQLGG